jgi:hypothetical protein
MAWTPYIGDPAKQFDEYAAPLWQQGTPIPGAIIPTRLANMNTGQRLQAAMAGLFGWSSLTPDQKFFRSTLGKGRWGGLIPLEPGETANRSANMVRRHADGTCDVIGLEASGKFYLDLGGRGARDMRAGRPH